MGAYFFNIFIVFKSCASILVSSCDSIRARANECLCELDRGFSTVRGYVQAPNSRLRASPARTRHALRSQDGPSKVSWPALGAMDLAHTNEKAGLDVPPMIPRPKQSTPKALLRAIQEGGPALCMMRALMFCMCESCGIALCLLRARSTQLRMTEWTSKKEIRAPFSVITTASTCPRGRSTTRPERGR